MTHEFVELCCINQLQQGDHIPLEAMSTSIASKHHLLQLAQTESTSGSAHLGSLALKVAIRDDLKTKIRRLKVGNLMPTGFDMVHQLFWSLEKNCVLQARISSWRTICSLMRYCSLDTPRCPKLCGLVWACCSSHSLMISLINLLTKTKEGDEPIDRPSLQFSPSAAGPETSSSSRPSGLAQIPEDDGMDFQPSDLRTGYDDMQEPEPAPIPSSTPQVSRMPGKAAPVPTAQHQPVQVDDDALNFEPCHAHQPAQSADGSLEPCHVDSRPT